MTKDYTLQLGALGILAVIFAHVGYGIEGQENFLGPLANYGGIAVDLFYFLSGYGLALSFSKTKSLADFYIKRASRIILPVWIVLALFFIFDAFIFSKGYEVLYMVKSFLLIFPTADLYNDVNSPLWYITPLVLYYLAFPAFFNKRRIVFSTFLFFMLGYIISLVPIDDFVFKLHYLAFPLGVLVAGYTEQIAKQVGLLSKRLRSVIAVLLLLLVAAASTYSGVDTAFEQYGSVIAMLSLVGLFFLVPLRSPILVFIGTYSFELYLLHWPLMSRFDFLHILRPWPFAWLAAWLGVLMVLSLILQSICVMVPPKQVS